MSSREGGVGVRGSALVRRSRGPSEAPLSQQLPWVRKRCANPAAAAARRWAAARRILRREQGSIGCGSCGAREAARPSRPRGPGHASAGSGAWCGRRASKSRPHDGWWIQRAEAGARGVATHPARCTGTRYESPLRVAPGPTRKRVDHLRASALRPGKRFGGRGAQRWTRCGLPRGQRVCRRTAQAPPLQEASGTLRADRRDLRRDPGAGTLWRS